MIWEVARREITTRSRTKAFRIMTVLLLVAAVAAAIIAAVWPDGDDDAEEVFFGAAERFDATAEDRLNAFGGEMFEFTRIDPIPDVDEALVDGVGGDDEQRIVVWLDDVDRLRWAEDDQSNAELRALLFGFLQQEAALERGAGAGLSPAETVALLTPTPIEDTYVDETDESEALSIGLAYLGLMISFILPQLYGQLIFMGVVEEKASRVVEVLLSHVRPQTLLIGKVLGIGLLALAQFTIVVGGLVIALLLTDQIEIPDNLWEAVPILALFVIAGFVLNAVLFALFGSLISRQEDGQQVILPLLVPLMAGLIVGQGVAFGGSNSLLVKVLSYIPLTSPMLVPARAARGTIEMWEVAVAFGLLLLAIVLTMRLASRVYEFTLLRTGSRVPWSEAIRLARR